MWCGVVCGLLYVCVAYDSGLDSVAIGFIYGEVLRAAPLHHTRLTYAVFSRLCKRLRLFEHDFSRSSALTPEVCCCAVDVAVLWLCCAVLCCAGCCAVLCCAVLCCVVLCAAVQIVFISLNVCMFVFD